MLTKFEQEIKKIVEDVGIALTPDYPIGHYKTEKIGTPIIQWTKIDKPNNLLDLLDLIKKNGSNCVQAVCGLPSGGLVCWDVDSKHKLGFDAIILNDFRELYPDLLAKMKIERTPSGGLHFYYRISLDGLVEFPSGGNIASRYTTIDERIISDKKTACFLEFKARGLLSRCYPSVNYTEVSGSVGVLSWGEHCCIYEQCKLYDELVKTEYIKTPSAYQPRYNEGENPYEQFDKSEEGSQVLIQDGWSILKSSGQFDWYKKKWKQNSKEVAATFNNATRLYKIFSTNADVDVKSYSPSNLLCQLAFGGNKKALYELLVSKGYGRLKNSIEQSIIKSRVLDDKPLPANFSEEGKKKFEQEKENSKQKYPFGTFWKESVAASGGMDFKISREDIYSVSKELGFRKHKEKICFIKDKIISYVTSEFYYNHLKSYIKEDNIDLLNTYEAFLQSSGEFTIKRLEDLDKSLILRSTKKESLKFFQNCYLRITDVDVEICAYEDVVGLIWETDIKKRDFFRVGLIELRKSTYWTFVKNAVGEFNDYILKCIGFYAHDHRDEDGYMVITTEQCENPEDGGGSGKNIFWSLFGLTTTFKTTPAVLISLNTNLLQSWDGQRIFCISDMPRNFEIAFFKDIITGNATVNKKYINEFEVDIEDMCKVGASSNFSFDNSDPGVKRRVRQIEFTNYYTLMGGVNKANNGRMFPKDWDEIEYLHFDNIMIHAIQKYLAAGNKIDIVSMTDTGWKKQFAQKYNHLYDFFKINIENWLFFKDVKNETIKKLYKDYCDENNINLKWQYTAQKMNKALHEFGIHEKIEVKLDYTFYENGITFRGKRFGAIGIEVVSVGEIEVEEEAPF